MLSVPSDLQLDALREVANVGCGHAASALSKLVGGRPVRIEVPQAHAVPSRQVGELLGGDQASVCGVVKMEGALDGKVVLVLSEQTAQQLAALLLDAPQASLELNVARSALEEVTNILASACLSAIGHLTTLTLLPSPPRLLRGSAEHIAQAILAGGTAGEMVVVLETRFGTAVAPPLQGRLLLLPDQRSLGTLLTRLGL
jgi:chemotaxis protein CheC